MLELILLYALGKTIAGKAAAKGKSGWPWVLLLVGAWFAGEFAGAVTATVLSGGEAGLFGLLLFAYAGAAAGAIFAFTLLGLMPAEEADPWAWGRRPSREQEETKVWALRRVEEDRFDEQGLRIRR
jgi:hypothetical protein